MNAKRPERMGSYGTGAQRWPALKAEPVREDEVVGMAAETHLGTAVLSYLLAGPILFGGIGWLLGLLWPAGRDWLIAAGVLIGMALSMYIIWLRYGKAEASGARPATVPESLTDTRSNE